jgi:hypothetical protein
MRVVQITVREDEVGLVAPAPPPADFSPEVRALDRRQRPEPLRKARCACQACGAHTFAYVGYTIGGSCQNCGSFELRLVDERPHG